MPKSRIFLYLCLSFIGGIFLNSIWQISQMIWLALLILGVFFISVLWAHKKAAVIGFSLLFLLLGIWQEEAAELKIIENELGEYNKREAVFVLTGVVEKEPDVRENSIKLTVSQLEIIDGERKFIKGKILVTANRYPQYQYGDKLEITGQLKRPVEFPDFDYQDYLAKDGIYLAVYYPKIELIGKGYGNFIYSAIYFLKDRLRESIYQNLSPPQSAILGAVILGDKRQISEEWKEKLNFAGVRHLTAVSGMHVAVLTAILMSFLIGIGLWPKQAFFLTVVFIVFFVILTGLQSSAVRAGIMGSIFLLAQYLGREKDSFRIIILTGGIMLLHNPLLLKSDVGFQLSFLAIIGINYLLPLFRNWLRKIPDFFQLRDILSMTLAAQIFTLPILIYNFGYFSLVSPLVNLLIVPLLPFIMGLGFILSLAGLIWHGLAWLVSLPLVLLLNYLVKAIDWFSGFSWSVYALEISWLWLPVVYLVFGLAAWQLKKKTKKTEELMLG